MAYLAGYALLMLSMYGAVGVSAAPIRRTFVVFAGADSTLNYKCASGCAARVTASRWAHPLEGVDAGQYSGLAINALTNTLYVADSADRNIYAIALYANGDKLRVGGPRKVVARNILTNNIAVSGKWNALFATDTAHNVILKVDLSQNDGEATTLYSHNEKLSNPTGLGTDTFKLYFGNSNNGLVTGSIIQAPEQRTVTSIMAGVATVPIVDSVKGLCLAAANVFYTDGKAGLYSVKKRGGAPVKINSGLRHGGGCAWDGDGTVYIADNTGVYRVPSTQRTLRPMFNMEKVVSIAASQNYVQQQQEAALDVEGGGDAAEVTEMDPAAADAADLAAANGGEGENGEEIINTPKGIAVIAF